MKRPAVKRGEFISTESCPADPRRRGSSPRKTSQFYFSLWFNDVLGGNGIGSSFDKRFASASDSHSPWRNRRRACKRKEKGGKEEGGGRRGRAFQLFERLFSQRRSPAFCHLHPHAPVFSPTLFSNFIRVHT